MSSSRGNHRAARALPRRTTLAAALALCLAPAGLSTASAATAPASAAATQTLATSVASVYDPPTCGVSFSSELNPTELASRWKIEPYAAGKAGSEVIGTGDAAYVRMHAVPGTGTQLVYPAIPWTPQSSIVRARVRGTLSDGSGQLLHAYVTRDGNARLGLDVRLRSVAADWTDVDLTLDASGRELIGPGPAELHIAYADPTGSGQTVDIDRLAVISCPTAVDPAWGHYDEAGLASLLGINERGAGGGQAGDLYRRHEGGTGFTNSNITGLAGIGWSGYDVVAGPDLTGDGRADVVARDAAGRLWVYQGDGYNSFKAVRQVGTGWGAMRELTLLPGAAGERPALVALDGAGNLRRYAFTGSTAQANGSLTLTGGQVIGWGWGGFKLVTVGDVTGDGRGDLLGIAANGDLLAYQGMANGTVNGAVKRLGTGWGFDQVVSPGDLNGDGLREIVVKSGDMTPLAYQFDHTGRFVGSRTLSVSVVPGERYAR